MKIERILQIVSWMSVGEKLTVSIVEERFSHLIKRRQLQRDFLAIFDANLPVTFDTDGRERTWYFDPSYARRIAPMFESLKEI